MSQSLRDEFEQVFARYRAQTMCCSVTRQMRRQPAWQEMIDLGPKIVPFLLTALGGDEYGISTQILLRDLTGEDPATSPGKVKKSAEDWRRWGRENGYDFS